MADSDSDDLNISHENVYNLGLSEEEKEQVKEINIDENKSARKIKADT